jgi:peptidoglycan/xylan/chitin deacetylase (PgdA/CDA1 family)
MIARPGRPLTLVGSLIVFVAVLALALMSEPGVRADPGLASGVTRYLTFGVNHAAVPAWVLTRELTYRVSVGVVSSVAVSGDGQRVPATYDPAAQKVMFSTDAANIALVLYDSATDPGALGQIAVTALHDDKRWALSMTFDDGYLSAYQYGTTYLDKYGWTGGIAVNGRALDNPYYGGKLFMNDAQMRDLVDRGWGIFNHTYSHNYVSQFPNAAAAIADIIRGRNRITAGGVPTPTVFVAPYVDGAYFDLIRLNNNASMSVYVYQGGGSTILTMETMTTRPTDLLAVGRDNVDHLDPFVDQAHGYAVANPSSHFWLYFNSHEVDPGCDPVETI